MSGKQTYTDVERGVAKCRDRHGQMWRGVVKPPDRVTLCVCGGAVWGEAMRSIMQISAYFAECFQFSYLYETRKSRERIECVMIR